MIQRLSRAKCYVLLLALASLFLVPAPTPAELKPGKQDKLITQLVCEFLKRGHLSKPEIGKEIAHRLFEQYLKELDPSRMYFLKGDIDEFKKSEDDLGAQLAKGDLSFAYTVFERFLTRVGERQKLVKELVEAPHDFTVKESIDTDNDSRPWAATEAEMRERWRKRIKFDLLMQRVAKKPVPEAEAKKKVLERYQGVAKRWKQVDNMDLLEVYLNALATSVDPHSTWMSPNTLDDFDIALRLNLDGIGAVLRSENGSTVVVELVPGGVAAKDGRLKAEDKIVGVAQGDGKFVDTTDMKLREVVRLIRGERGTKVQLKVVPVGKLEPLTYELTRARIELKNQEARGEIIEDGKKADGTPYRIGVIDLPSFYGGGGKAERKSATEDTRRLLESFKEKKVDGVILDLRRNGGGLLSESLSLTGLFIDEGPVVQVKGSRGDIGVKNDPERGVVYSGPLMVLVSHFSASASEILAGALQDYHRAVIVGDTCTFGKGTVQTMVDLGEQISETNPPKLGALKLTVQQFYRPNGDSTQARGVVSDVVVPSFTEYLAPSEKERPHALAFDKIKAARYVNSKQVTSDLKNLLKERSAERVKNSKEFTKLAKEGAAFKNRKDRKSVTLNEKELRAQLAKDDEDKIDDKLKEIDPDGKSEAVYKYKRNFINDEILHIMEDEIRGK